ncbi:MAG TPA: GNAT family N-acetyltransferase, partial [Conexibacter sp.]|nr:GNAT family N-acetyltransferase [Conexibacter sp.]
MPLPAGVRLHHPAGSDEDAVAVLVLTTACQVADTGRSDRELVDVIEEWKGADVDLAHDAWLAEDSGGEMIGYAFVSPPEAEVRVHPRARGRGLGSHLRELVEARARD